MENVVSHFVGGSVTAVQGCKRDGTYVGDGVRSTRDIEWETLEQRQPELGSIQSREISNMRVSGEGGRGGECYPYPGLSSSMSDTTLATDTLLVLLLLIYFLVCLHT